MERETGRGLEIIDETITIRLEELHREDASCPEDTFPSDIQVDERQLQKGKQEIMQDSEQVTVCVPAECENPEIITKTWAEEVNEMYPVSDDNLNYFPDTYVGKYTDEMQCSGNEDSSKQASSTTS